MIQMKGQCNRSLKMLLSLGIEDLHDDGFEGSVNEDGIFRDVFFGQTSGRISKKCLVTGAINFENDDNNSKDVSFRSNSEYSVMTSQDDSGPEDSGFFKRRKVLVEEYSNSNTKSYLEKVVNPSTPSKEADSCSCQTGPVVTCRLVESSGQGVKSSCYLLKGRLGNGDVSKCRLCSPDTSFPNVNASPVSQESHVSVQLKSNISTNSIEADVDNNQNCGKASICSFEDQNDKPKSKFKNRKGNCHLEDDDLLLSTILKNRSTTKSSRGKRKSRVRNVSRKHRSRKGGCRLLPRTGGPNHVAGNLSGLSRTTALSRLIDFGVINLNETIQYRNLTDGSVMKHGLVTRDGILCRCCGNVLSVSKFKIHAGFTPKHPCSSIFTESGKSFTTCQLEAWSTENKIREGAMRTVRVEEIDRNDDSCGLCGDGGELICCDNCPSTFHQVCLCVQELPEGDWFCSMCSCRSCGNVISNNKTSISSARKCLQCKHKYHKECVRETGLETGSVPSSWFCRESCKEIHSGLDSRAGLMNLISDGFSWTVLRCIHDGKKVDSDERFVGLMADCNMKLSVAATIMEESFLPMVDPRTGIDMIPHVVYNQGSEFARLDYEGFYTVVLEKDDVLLCVACVRIHGVEVAEMPLIATCSKYRRQGMCRRLMKAIEELLKWLKVEKLVLSAIPSLVETWTNGFGFGPLEPEEKKRFSKTNLMVFPGTVWLKKTMYQSSKPNFDLEESGKDLVKQISKLSSEEPPSRIAGNSPEMGCDVKSSIIEKMDQ